MIFDSAQEFINIFSRILLAALLDEVVANKKPLDMHLFELARMLAR